MGFHIRCKTFSDILCIFTPWAIVIYPEFAFYQQQYSKLEYLISLGNPMSESKYRQRCEP